jgi:SAM-dependent methyltransferase
VQITPNPERYREFYEVEYTGSQYAPPLDPQEHAHFAELNAFVQQYGLDSKKVLEVGCGRGAFQSLSTAYFGVDLAANAGQFLDKPFACASAKALPFCDNTFDAVWTITVLEHVPDPQLALSELRRVLRPGGLLFLAPAWQCRSWAAQGYPVRPYSDFNWRGKLIKASIPVRNSVAFRSGYIFPSRMLHWLTWRKRPHPVDFQYRKLTPNYEKYWMSDSDACNSMDPFGAILWFMSRGDKCLSHPTFKSQFFVRTGCLVFEIGKRLP